MTNIRNLRFADACEALLKKMDGSEYPIEEIATNMAKIELDDGREALVRIEITADPEKVEWFDTPWPHGKEES